MSKVNEDEGGGPTNTTGAEVAQKQEPMTKIQRRKSYAEFLNGTNGKKPSKES